MTDHSRKSSTIKLLKEIQSHPEDFRFHPKLINKVLKKIS